MDILGVPIDNLTRDEICTRVKVFLDEPKFHQIATVNPEFLVESERNENFRAVLEQCDLRVADGFGIALAFFLKDEKLKCRFPGADLMDEVIHKTSLPRRLIKAGGRGLSVYLAIRKDGLSSFEEIKFALLKKYPNLKINGADIDPKIHDSQFMIHDSIVFCNFGAPAQELFLAKLKNNPGNVRLAMGVGGSFDYLTGKQKRAPEWLRTIGLEWLWRLIQQPKRFKRIFDATIVFFCKVLTKG